MKCNALLFLFASLICVSVHAKDDAAASQNVPIKGIPTANNAVRKRGTPYAEIQGFVIDRKTGGVGACIEVSENPFDGDDSLVESMVFSFPQLRYDEDKRQIMLGDTIVEKRGIFRWWRNPEYEIRLQASEVESQESFGGNPSIVYDVYLVARGSRTNAVLAANSGAGSSPTR